MYQRSQAFRAGCRRLLRRLARARCLGDDELVRFAGRIQNAIAGAKSTRDFARADFPGPDLKSAVSRNCIPQRPDQIARVIVDMYGFIPGDGAVTPTPEMENVVLFRLKEGRG